VRLAQVAQLCGVGIPVLRFRPRGGFVEHRFANGALDTIRPEQDITCRSGPILEAQHDRFPWPLSVALEALGWEGTTTGGQAVQESAMKFSAMKRRHSTWT